MTKEKVFKKISIGIAFGLAVTIVTPVCMPLIQSTVKAEDEYEIMTSEEYKYRLFDDGHVVLEDYIGDGKEVVIPEKIDGHDVTELGWYVFYKKDVISIVIPKSITEIPRVNPFRFCKHLINIEVNEDNTKYDSRNGCNAIIDSLTGEIITACNSTTIPEGVTRLGDSSFAGVTMSLLEIPKTVTGIGQLAFEDSNIDRIEVDPDNTNLDSRDGCNAIIGKSRLLYIKDESGDDLVSEDVLIAGCKNTVIPNTVKAIGSDAFMGVGIKSVSIPSSVKYVDYRAFCDSGVEEVFISEGLEECAFGAFFKCNTLKKITIPSTLIELDYGDFDGCVELESIEVAEKNPVYDSRDNCNAIIRKEDDVLLVGSNNTVIPEGVKEIYYEAFKGRKGLKTINIPKGLEYIDRSAFEGCTGLEELLFPEGWCDVDERSFKDCTGLNRVKVMGRIIINAGAFNNCSNLKEIWIPSSMKESYFDDIQTNYEGGLYPPFEGCVQLTIVTPKDSYAQQYAISHNIPYRNEDIWSGGQSDNNDSKTSVVDNKTSEDDKTSSEQQQILEKKNDKEITEVPLDTQTTDNNTGNNTSGQTVDNVTKFNIINKKRYKISKKITIRDDDGIKQVTLNTKNIKFKSGKKNISFKLSKYKKYIKKKNKWNKLIVVDVNGNKKVIQFKVK